MLRFEQKIPAGERNLFSGAVNNLLSVAHAVLDKPSAGPDDDGGPPPLKLGAQTTKAGATAGTNGATPGTSANQVNAANEKAHGMNGDLAQITSANQAFQFTHIGGFNQSTTSTAWCGPNVVTAYQSSLAFLKTEIVPFVANPQQFAFSGSSIGVSFSDNGGESFADQVVLNLGATILTDTENDAQAMAGNPVEGGFPGMGSVRFSVGLVHWHLAPPESPAPLPRPMLSLSLLSR